MENVAIQAIRDGHSLIKLENSTQMQVAVQRPRDESKILTDALKELETYRTAAISALYNKPVGKDDSGKMQNVIGLSIRAAESLANRWRNSSYGCEIISEDPESITLGAVFLDMETNCRHAMTRRVSKSLKRKDGSQYKLFGDRLDTHVQAQASKLLREVILRSLPAGLKEDYKEKAVEIMRKLGPDQIKRMLNAFLKHKVTQKDIEFYLDKTIDKISLDDYIELQGLYNAIEEGESSAEEVFGTSKQRQNVNDAIKKKADEVKNSPKQEPKEQPPKQTQSTPETSPAAEQPTLELQQDSEDEKLALLNEISGLFASKNINKGKTSVIIAKALGEFKPLTNCNPEELRKVIAEMNRGA